ncbi:MAG: glycosyltransferase, partial [Pseudomonadota bacterium]
QIFTHRFSARQTSIIAGSGISVPKTMPVYRKAGARVRFLCLARLLADKGIYELIGAARLLSNMAIEIVIAGSIDPQNPSSLTQAEVDEFAKLANVTFMGHIADTTALEADVFILPSHREGLPKALLEGAALAKPLIAADAPGSRDICIHEETGLLVPINDASALAEAIRILAQDARLRKKLGENAWHLVQKKFSETIIGGEITALYKQLLTTR